MVATPTPLEALLELFCTWTMGMPVGWPRNAACPCCRKFPRRPTLEAMLLAEWAVEAPPAEEGVALPDEDCFSLRLALGR